MKTPIPTSAAAETPAAETPAKPGPATIVYANGIATLNGKVAVSYDPEDRVPAGVEHLVVGRELKQWDFMGLAKRRGYVCVGPAHPVYAAANLAWQDGATQITVTGVPADSPATEPTEDKPDGIAASTTRSKLQFFFEKVADQITVKFA